jgi:hypothetical protein
MDYKEALNILNINLNETDYKDVTLDLLKKKYHKQALIHHPDKNGNTPESTEMFKRINHAYIYLKREINYHDGDGDFEMNCGYDDYSENQDQSDSFSWNSILQMFMMGILEGKYNELFLKIVNDIVSGYKTISIKLFEGLSKDTCLDVYTFLSKHRSTFRLTDEILEKVRDIVLLKYDNVEIYKLNPSMNDLLNNNIYKLYINNELFLVPLWHDELYFEKSGKEIIVFCEPELPQHIKIDEDNNIYIEVNIPFNELHHDLVTNTGGKIEIPIGDNIFFIQISELFIKKTQFYKIKNQGITIIKENDIYNISDKGDIVVKITLI